MPSPPFFTESFSYRWVLLNLLSPGTSIQKCIYSCLLLKMTMQKFKMKWIILELFRRHRKILPLTLHWSIWTQNVLSWVDSWDVSWGIVKDPQAAPQEHGGATALCTVARAHIFQGQGRKERGCCLKALFITQRKSWMAQRPWEVMFRLEELVGIKNIWRWRAGFSSRRRGENSRM